LKFLNACTAVYCICQVKTKI